VTLIEAAPYLKTTFYRKSIFKRAATGFFVALPSWPRNKSCVDLFFLIFLYIAGELGGNYGDLFSNPALGSSSFQFVVKKKPLQS
jgi:hypothetical protein